MQRRPSPPAGGGQQPVWRGGRIEEPSFQARPGAKGASNGCQIRQQLMGASWQELGGVSEGRAEWAGPGALDRGAVSLRVERGGGGRESSQRLASYATLCRCVQQTSMAPAAATHHLR